MSDRNIFKVRNRTPLCYTILMQHKEFLDDLRRRSPSEWTYEIEARPYKNAKGIDELIYLQRGYWDYVEWAQQNTDIDFVHWVVHCENNPVEDFTLSHLLMYWLWYDHCNRFRQGMPTPDSFPPMGYEGWADEYHARQKN